MTETMRVLIRRQIPSAHRGSLRYLLSRSVIMGVADNLKEGNVKMLVSPTDNKLNRFRGCMDGLSENARNGESDRLIGLVGCKGCPISEIYAGGTLPKKFSIGSELSEDDNYSRWITVYSCPGIIALLEMVEEGQTANRYAYGRLLSEAPCMNKARRFAKIDVPE